MNPNPPLTPSEDGQPPVAPSPATPVQDATPVPPVPVENGVPQPAPAPEPVTSEPVPQPFAPQDQPPVVPAPMEPTPQPTPQVFGSGPAVPVPAPASPQGSKKKIALLAGIIGGVVVLAGVGAALFFMLTAVSKEDYAAAATQLNTLAEANEGFSSNVKALDKSAGSSVEGRFDSAVSEFDAGIATIRAENDTLKELKAVRVGEGQKLYAAFDKKLDAYLAFAEDYGASMKALRPTLEKCGAPAAGSDLNSLMETLKACADSFSEKKDIPNAAVKEFNDTMATEYKKFVEIYEELIAMTGASSTNRAAYQQLMDDMNDVTDAMKKAGDALEKSIDDKIAELDPDDAYKALAEYLTNQQK